MPVRGIEQLKATCPRRVRGYEHTLDVNDNVGAGVRVNFDITARRDRNRDKVGERLFGAHRVQTRRQRTRLVRREHSEMTGAGRLGCCHLHSDSGHIRRRHTCRSGNCRGNGFQCPSVLTSELAGNTESVTRVSDSDWTDWRVSAASRGCCFSDQD